MKKLLLSLLVGILLYSCNPNKEKKFSSIEQTNKENPSWQGKPFDKIIKELQKQYYVFDLASGDFSFSLFSQGKDPKIIDWNQEDVMTVKKTIMNILPYEPIIQDEGESLSGREILTWTASKYNVALTSTHDGDLMIIFSIK